MSVVNFMCQPECLKAVQMAGKTFSMAGSVRVSQKRLTVEWVG